MSLRILYRKIPLEKRLCHICGDPIKRNIDLLDGEICHHGCINKVGLKPTHRCLDCYSLLTADKVVRTHFESGVAVTKTCGLCGSTNLRPLHSGRMAGSYFHVVSQGGSDWFEPLLDRGVSF